MSGTVDPRRFEDVLVQIRQPARLIGEEAGAGPGFGCDPAELRVVLGFPDTYEIGISNQALQILYHLAGNTAGVGVERTYLPWTDAISAMRREGIPLLTMETWTPVVQAHLFGLTLQHEFNYTNILEMLDLAGIPLHAEERTGKHPLLLAGGPACADFLPLSRFFDAVAVGDGEELFPEILTVLVEAGRQGLSREATKRRLSTVEGVFVPGISEWVRRRTIARLAGAPYPDSSLVPLTAGVHDRAWVEIMRGCTRGCRFCQAGMWYRPVRERPPDEVMAMAEAQLRATGHQELALASLSTTDYSCVESLLARVGQDHPEVRVSLPSLRVDSAAVRLARLVSPTGPSLTLAPEAGSRRMHAVINKNVTDEDVLAAAEEAFIAGMTTLKLYFMIGLPLEEDADVTGIAELCLRVRDLGRRILGPRAGRLRLNISVNNFVPKPFTPFQWAGMADRATLRRRQEVLRSRLRRPGVRLTLHDVDKSYLEAALARGDEGLSAVIEGAWGRGARFDSWTEEFRGDAWREAFAAAGTSAEELATATIPRDVPLPWEVIHGVVDREFLWSEWEKAHRGGRTGDCRWEGCTGCGACEGPQRNDLAAERAAEAGLGADAGRAPTPVGSPPGVRARTAAACGAAAAAGGAAGVTARSGAVRVADAARPGPRLRYVATFSVTGRGRFVGHLDRLELLRRAVRKAGGRPALSAGMRPKPVLCFALPLPVGVEGLRELCEFALAEEPGPDFSTRLAGVLPAHMRLLALEPYRGARSLPARVVGASYEVQVGAAGGGPGGVHIASVLAGAADRFSAADGLPVEEFREGRARRVDVKRYVEHVSVREGPDPACTISFSASVTPAGTARPERVIEALGRLAGTPLSIQRIQRTEIHLS
ncbi:MAG: TIGR03936 family radical SAM-associated protein [Actinomycetia bacterium]|nr:TIGR03936 family radical SAM-associated protein [Actinomycetes bacterium]